ncbi:ATP-dependent RNA helicase [Linnemannia schmuckeri]|uniref:ATP-dependent RNA helicase n=1 Tax=Linnemannia schmuckeri TaxID=64567 RepID=A0A9P5RR93_9FUNG|nr:ATP-dependent RNA helicase [Linnemannia schmuckeri]
MAWLVEDNPTPVPAKRSNAKRKKGSALNVPTTKPDTTPHNNNNNNSDGEHDTTEGGDNDTKKELSKSQRKRARHQAASAEKSMTEDEKNWNQVSLFNVPDLPSNPEPILISKKAAKAANRSAAAAKGKKGGKGGKKLPGGGEIVVADYGKMDDWGWTPVSTEGIMMDDMDGFLCLEELDGVEVAYEGSDATGKTIVFKHDAKAAATKKGKNVKHSEPLFVENGEVFYDIDTFDEETLIKQQQEGTQNTDGDAVMAEVEAEGNDNDNQMDIDEEEKESVAKKAEAPVKERKQKKEVKEQSAKAEKKEQKTVTAANGSEKATEEEIKEGSEAAIKKLSKKEKAALRAEEFKAKRAEAKAAKAALKAEEVPKMVCDPMEGVDLDFDISAWKDYKFSPMIENGLKKQKFTKPSQIQEQALPLALAGRDVIGVAETGSGKTLAFGFPILQCLAQQAAVAKENNGPLNETLTALILTPTRELAIQVKDHLVAFTQFTGHHVVPIVGGMSVQKQTRQLDRNPAIVVATPGRLWELISTNPTYSERLIQARFLVLDEADRMLESGHFEELSNILKLLERKREKTSDWDQHIKAAAAAKAANGSDDDNQEKKDSKDKEDTVKPTSIARTDYEFPRQTFIFTATLSKELSLNLTRKKNKAKSAEQSTEGTLEDLMERIEFHDESPALVNVGSEKIVASKLLEAKIDCLTTEKDLYLYYFAKKYPGRTLVFVNSIDAIRHLVPMMQLLGIEALGMHAQMQQRQRLKNLDRFKSNPFAFMIASDVAARGLDIPLVDHVIHYQVPRSGDIYVHRSGRTARAENEGISLLICGPDEVQLYRKMCVTLKKDQTGGIPDFPVDRGVITEMKKRVALAKKIDEQEHRVQKSAHQDDWMLKSAEAMDIILDEDVLNAAPKSSKNKSGDDEDNSAMTGRKNKIKAMRAELKAMLQTRMMPQGASAKYITSGAIRDLADRLRDSANHNPLMPAHIKSTALEDIKAQKKSTRKKAATTPTTNTV